MTELAIRPRHARGALLVAIAALGITIVVGGPGLVLEASVISAANAQTAPPAGFADVVDKVKPAVISVIVKFGASARLMDGGSSSSSKHTPMDRLLRRFGNPDNTSPNSPSALPRSSATWQGSGFFISADGYAVTNNHVVGDAETVQVVTDGGTTYAAKVVGTDSRTDIALIKVDGRIDFPYVKFAEAAPRIGDWVLAVGNPFGLGGTVTAGIVSARGRDIGKGPYDDFIQIDAPINSGNSGGPAFDLNGNVIGVNTAIFSPSGGSVGIGFAIPAETAKAVVTQLKDKGAVTRGFIGVQLQDITAGVADYLGLKSARGALVAEPQANGPAARAGVETGDVITAIDGNEVRDAREVARTIGNTSPGASVKLTVTRKGQEKIIDVTLGELPNVRNANIDPPPKSPRDSRSKPRKGGQAQGAHADEVGRRNQAPHPAGWYAEQC
jgi:serine protease Do